MSHKMVQEVRSYVGTILYGEVVSSDGLGPTLDGPNNDWVMPSRIVRIHLLTHTIDFQVFHECRDGAYLMSRESLILPMSRITIICRMVLLQAARDVLIKDTMTLK